MMYSHEIDEIRASLVRGDADAGCIPALLDHIAYLQHTLDQALVRERARERMEWLGYEEVQPIEGSAIRNMAHAAQITDYANLRLPRNVKPMDVDGFIEWGGDRFVFMEFKYGDAELSDAQWTALTQLCYASHRNRAALGIIASHRSPTPQPIDAGNTIVRQVWRDARHGWVNLAEERTTREVVLEFLGIRADWQPGQKEWRREA